MTVLQAGGIAGPLVGGALIPLVGFSWLYLIDTVTLFATLGAVVGLPPLPVEGALGSPGLRAVVDGFRYLRGQPVLMMSFVVDLIAMVFGMPRALFPEMADVDFGGPSEGGLAFALLFAAIPAGAVVGGVLSGLGVAGRAAGPRGDRGDRRLGPGDDRVRRVGHAGAVWRRAAILVVAVVMLAVGGAADMASSAFRNVDAARPPPPTPCAAGCRASSSWSSRADRGSPTSSHGAAAAVTGAAVAAAGGGVLVVVGTVAGGARRAGVRPLPGHPRLTIAGTSASVTRSRPRPTAHDDRDAEHREERVARPASVAAANPMPHSDSAKAAPRESAMERAEELKPRSASEDAASIATPVRREAETHAGPGHDEGAAREPADSGRAGRSPQSRAPAASSIVVPICIARSLVRSVADPGLQLAGGGPDDADDGEGDPGLARGQAPALLQHQDDVGLAAEEGGAHQTRGCRSPRAGRGPPAACRAGSAAAPRRAPRRSRRAAAEQRAARARAARRRAPPPRRPAPRPGASAGRPRGPRAAPAGGRARPARPGSGQHAPGRPRRGTPSASRRVGHQRRERRVRTATAAPTRPRSWRRSTAAGQPGRRPRPRRTDSRSGRRCRAPARPGRPRSTSIDGARPQVEHADREQHERDHRRVAGPRRSLHGPAATMPTTPLASGAANASAYRPRPSRSRLIVGMTVVTAIASKALNAISAKTAIVVARYAGARMPPRSRRVVGEVVTRSRLGPRAHSRSKPAAHGILGQVNGAPRARPPRAGARRNARGPGLPRRATPSGPRGPRRSR